MNELQKNLAPKVIPPPTKEDKSLAHEVHQKILATITKVRASESDLEHDYVSLGQLIYQMQTKTLWMTLGYASWKDYFDFLQTKFGKGRTQLYGYIGTVKALSPHIDSKTLAGMGISKASELKKAVLATGKAPSDELVELATTPITLSDFRQRVLEEFHIIDHTEKGTWHDFKGCYLTPEEKQTIDEAFDLAKNIDPVVSVTLPAHQQFKEALLRLCEEFIGTHGYKGDY